MFWVTVWLSVNINDVWNPIFLFICFYRVLESLADTKRIKSKWFNLHALPAKTKNAIAGNAQGEDENSEQMLN